MHADILTTLAIYRRNDILYYGYKCHIGVVVNSLLYILDDSEIKIKSAISWDNLYIYNKYGIDKCKKYNFNTLLYPTYMHYITSDIHILIEINGTKKMVYYHISSWPFNEYKKELNCNNIIDTYNSAINKYCISGLLSI